MLKAMLDGALNHLVEVQGGVLTHGRGLELDDP